MMFSAQESVGCRSRFHAAGIIASESHEEARKQENHCAGLCQEWQDESGGKPYKQDKQDWIK